MERYTEKEKETALLSAQYRSRALSTPEQIANVVVWIGMVAFSLWVVGAVLRALFHAWLWGRL